MTWLYFCVAFAFCSFNVTAEEIRFGDADYKLDKVYRPIYGSPAGKSYFLHYCLPDLRPAGKAGCGDGLPESNNKIVQVKYESFIGRIDKAVPLLETAAIFEFPFGSLLKVDANTPYIKEYRKRAISPSGGRVSYHVAPDGYKKIEGLTRYDSASSPFWIWAPEDLSRYKTKIGNPIMFVCSPYSCRFIQDLQNGWVVSVRFSESALYEWRSFYLKVNESTQAVFGG